MASIGTKERLYTRKMKETAEYPLYADHVEGSPGNDRKNT